MKLSLLTMMILTLSSPAMAKLIMKPGKWKLETAISQEGKSVGDPMAKMREAMKDMSPAQRKQMEEMMAKMTKTNPDMPKVGFDKNGMTICYTKEMLEGDLGLKKQQEDQKCKVSDFIKTSSKMSMKFKCEDGATGDSQWNITDPTHMTGLTRLVSAKGKKSEVKFKAEFLSAKCD
jgi:hypothetical protein